MIQIEYAALVEPTNPGGTGCIGWVVRVDGKIKHNGFKVVGEGPGMTNGYAEWCALGFALAWLHDQQPLFVNGQDLTIAGHSALSINQLNGTWQVKEERLAKCRERCLELLKALAPRKWAAVCVPRTDNARAIQLARQAYRDHDGTEAPQRA